MASITPIRQRRLRDEGNTVPLDILNLYFQAGNENTKTVRYGRPYGVDLQLPKGYGSSFYGQAGNYIVTGITVAERLPIVGGDEDGWGTIMNAFLSVFFAADGEALYKNIETVTLAAESHTVTLPSAMGNTNYIVTATPNWNTTVWIPDATITTADFVVQFSNPAPASAKLRWWATPNA